MRDIAIVGFAQSEHKRSVADKNEVEMLMPVVQQGLANARMTKDDIDFTCYGSTDYLAGVGFSFVMALDAIGPWPPVQESHVEMDGAWALYEAWVKLQLGEINTAFVYCYGKSSPGAIGEVLTRQLDPYTVGPLWPDPISLAALQARSLFDAGLANERDLAEIAARSRKAGLANPYAHVAYDRTADQLLADEPLIDPLRIHDCPPISDGVAVVVLAADNVARDYCDRPAWIRGIDHRIESAVLGRRDLTTSPSTAIAAEKAGLGDQGVDIAELHAPFTHQEVVLRRTLGLGDDVDINPSGGALCANPIMATGLVRIGEVAQRIIDGTANRGVAHATQGHCLQQNLVCVLEGEG